MDLNGGMVSMGLRGRVCLESAAPIGSDVSQSPPPTLLSPSLSLSQ